MKKQVDLELIMEKVDKTNIIEDVGHNTICICKYLTVAFKLDNMVIQLTQKELKRILLQFGFYEEFYKKSLEIVGELQNELISYMDSKNRKIKDSLQLYYNNIDITYYPSGYYCILITDESARTELVEKWKQFIEKEFR